MILSNTERHTLVSKQNQQTSQPASQLASLPACPLARQNAYTGALRWGNVTWCSAQNIFGVDAGVFFFACNHSASPPGGNQVDGLPPARSFCITVLDSKDRFRYPLVSLFFDRCLMFWSGRDFLENLFGIEFAEGKVGSRAQNLHGPKAQHGRFLPEHPFLNS